MALARNKVMEEDNEEEGEDDDDEWEGSSSGDNDDKDLIARITRTETATQTERFKETGPAHSWCETQFYKNQPLECSPTNVVFWKAWAEFELESQTEGKFVCPDVCLCVSTRRGEALVGVLFCLFL
jgi:hypothetical protein